MNLPKFIITMDGYKYDDGFHDDFNVSEELQIEYYD